jgi:hypothetical protein
VYLSSSEAWARTVESTGAFKERSPWKCYITCVL